MTNAADPHAAAAPETAGRPFRVHLRGVVELLSRSIYSGPQVYLRELIQNAHDAIAARRSHDGGGTRITITPAFTGADELVVADDGIGLNADEVEHLLATVGRSSKRDFLDMPRQDRLGQFGIGLLSCFMIADEIRVISRSATDPDAAPVEWTGRADGTFSVRTLTGARADSVAIGTRVFLRPRSDDARLAGESAVVELARRYGEYLDTPIDIVRADGRETRINRTPVFTAAATADRTQLMELGQELLGAMPLEAIPLDVPATGTTGVAYVLPFAPAPGARQASRVYLGGMLLSTSLEDLLPDWGFFVRCVINTTGLHATASREALIDDSALEETRTELGTVLRRWLLSAAVTRPATLVDFMAVHQMGLKAMAMYDDELARLVMPYLRFDTSAGTASLKDLASGHARLRYAESVEEFRQLAPLAPVGEPLVNAGYVFDAELLRRAPDFIPGLSVARARADELLESLAEPPLDVRGPVMALEDAAQSALSDTGCDVQVRCFHPSSASAIFVAGRSAHRAAAREQVAVESGGLFGSLLGKLAAGSTQGPGGVPARRGLLCLNWNSELVRMLSGLAAGGEEAAGGELAVELRSETSDGAPGRASDSALAPALRVLYAQAMLAAQHPLGTADAKSLDTALTDIVRLSVGRDTAGGAP